MADFSKIQNTGCLKENLEFIRTEYEKYRNMEMPALTEELFNSFYKTGQRQEYERAFFLRRAKLLFPAMMGIIYDEEEYIEVLIDVIDAICEETTWALPAHMSKGCEHPERVIDLFSAETGQSLTEICEFLSNKLPERTRALIKQEVKRRIIDPFIEERFPWEGFNHNWAAVCGGAVGITFLRAFPDEFEKAEERINNALRTYLSGFGNDGISTEGPGYLNYGFWYFTGFADLYREMRGVDLTDNPRVKSIAMCQQNMFLNEKSVISFGDCLRHEPYSSGLAHYYRNRYGEGIKIIHGGISLGIDHCFRFLPCVRTLMWTDESLAGRCEPMTEESYFEDCGWYISRQDKFALAAKSGNNGVSHNHNDIGGFIIADVCGQLIADFGSGEYTHEYFNEGRYEYLCTSSRGHSVPIIDGEYQRAGSDFGGKVIQSGDGVFETDIAKAYGGTVQSIKRKFTVHKACVEMTDHFEFSDSKTHDITERFVSVIKPEIKNGDAVIGNMTLKCDEPPVLGYEYLTNHFSKRDILYFVDYKAKNSFSIKFEIL